MCFLQISACLGRNLQPNGLDVNALTEKMQTLSDQVSSEHTSAVHLTVHSWCLKMMSLPLSSNQMADESAVAGSDSPADFFTQLPKKEKESYRIPVSSGERYTHKSFMMNVQLFNPS